MKKFGTILVCLSVMMLAFAGTVQAQNGGFYGALKAGGSWMDQSGPGVSDNATSAITTSTDWDDDGALFGAAVGYNWVDMDVPVRTELEYMYHTPIEYKYTNSSNSTSFKNEITVQTVFVNAAWDWHNDTDFVPYVTAGAGVAIIDEDYSASGMTLSSSSDTTTNFAYNVGAGVAWEMTENWLLDLSYRYEDYGNTSGSVTGSSTGLTETFDKVKDLSSHNAILGIRYQF